MKKIIMVLVVLIMFGVVTNLFAGIYGNISLGIPVGKSYYYIEDHEKRDYSETFFTNMELGYKNYFFNSGIEYRLYTGIQTFGNRKGCQAEGWPFEDIYSLGTKISYKGIYCQYNHFCAHPIIYKKTYNSELKQYQYNTDDKSWLMSATSIKIGYEFEIK